MSAGWRIISVLLMCAMLGACASRIPLEPKDNNTVEIPMPPGNYSYVIADDYKISGYSSVQNATSTTLVPFHSTKRNNIFYVLRYDDAVVPKQALAGLIASVVLKQDGPATQPAASLASKQRALEAVCRQLNAGDACYKANDTILGDPEISQLVPEATMKDGGGSCKERWIPCDPPSSTILNPLNASAVYTYQVKRKYTSANVQYGLIKSDKALYNAANLSVYPGSYWSGHEKWAWASPISINIGFAKNAIWNNFETEPEGMNDSKFMYGLGYTLESGGEFFSFQMGVVESKLDGKRTSDPYVGLSVDVTKILDALGKK